MASSLDRFCITAPFAVMTRVLVQDFMGQDLDRIFESHSDSQYEHIASFHSVAVAVADVALRFCENFNQAYKKHSDDLKVSVQSFYAKTRGVEPKVSEAIVAHSAARASVMQEALGIGKWEVIPGYRCLTVDGNALAKSDKRLGVLRESKGAPLPGKVVARFDLQTQLFDRVYVLLDGHAQESTCCDRILFDLQANEVLIADRHYCVVSFMEGITNASAFFVIRQHGRLLGVLLGDRAFEGEIETGKVYEQQMRLTAHEDSMVVRRITVALDRPTRNGDTEVHILTNLPMSTSPLTIANAYRRRWEEETAFHVLQMTLTCELSSIGHPMAATFLFCMSVMAYNLRQTLYAALFAAHSESDVLEVSQLHVSKNISDYTPGMLVSITLEEWDAIIPKTTKGVANMLTGIAGKIRLENFSKSTRGPKAKKPFRSHNVKSKHVSTAKLLAITHDNHP